MRTEKGRLAGSNEATRGEEMDGDWTGTGPGVKYPHFFVEEGEILQHADAKPRCEGRLETMGPLATHVCRLWL